MTTQYYFHGKEMFSTGPVTHESLLIEPYSLSLLGQPLSDSTAYRLFP